MEAEQQRRSYGGRAIIAELPKQNGGGKGSSGRGGVADSERLMRSGRGRASITEQLRGSGRCEAAKIQQPRLGLRQGSGAAYPQLQSGSCKPRVKIPGACTEVAYLGCAKLGVCVS